MTAAGNGDGAHGGGKGVAVGGLRTMKPILGNVDLLAGGDAATAAGLAVADVLDDDGAVDAGVGGELPQRGFAGAADDVDADLGVAVELHVLEGGLGADEGDEDDLLHRGLAQSGSSQWKGRFSNDWKVFFQWLENCAWFFQ